LRFAIAAFIAGGSFLFFLPELPLYWMLGCFLLGIIFLFLAYIGKPLSHLRRLAIVAFIFVLGLAWNARYVENRLHYVLSQEMEGKEFTI